MLGISYTLSQIAGIVGAKSLHLSSDAGPIDAIAFDSRQVYRPGETLFVALKGDKRDGHQFADNAAEKGVKNFLLSDSAFAPEGCNYVLVENTLEALQALAAFHRSRFELPVFAITGSNGKTIVKEWLSTLLEQDFQIVKSPKSYNSQVGVPLSVLQINEDADLGIFEAGISRLGEMEKLEPLIGPKFGIMTHFGDAHKEGFRDAGEKLEEKLKLFKNCDLVFVSADDDLVLEKMRSLKIACKTIGFGKNADLQILQASADKAGWVLELQEGDGLEGLELPQPGPAALENAALAVLVARHLGLSFDRIREGLQKLQSISMRTELISDNPEITIINDAYNADEASIHNAFSLLEFDSFQAGKAIILSDLEHLGGLQKQTQGSVLQDAQLRFGSENVILIGPVFKEMVQENSLAYASTEKFLEEFDYQNFRNKTVLLKGARKFELEKIIPYLSRRVNATLFKVNLNHLNENLRFFRSLLPHKTRIMAMVKAFAYGSGTWEIAQAMQREGVDYLAVAYLSEGIALRTRNIDLPIMVMNPDLSGVEQLFHFGLEPEVFNLEFLKKYYAAGKILGNPDMKVHIKVETGMRRLGFTDAELPGLILFLNEHPGIQVTSVFSHLSGADEARNDDFSRIQVKRFLAFADRLALGLPNVPMLHILNTAGILRFPEYAMDMVRPGLGLYGLSPIGGKRFAELKEVGSLHTIISQIREYPENTPIGYGLSETTKRESRIATLPIGYADGIRRSLSNGKVSFLIHGKYAPVMGRVCMDMLMVDVTDIPEAKEGDEVVLFGEQDGQFQSVEALAEGADTIAYEILSGISPRVRRVYVRE